MLTVIAWIWCIITGLLWLLCFYFLLFDEETNGFLERGRYVTIITTSIYAALWVIYPGKTSFIWFFFLWAGMMVISFIPKEKAEDNLLPKKEE